MCANNSRVQVTVFKLLTGLFTQNTDMTLLFFQIEVSFSCTVITLQINTSSSHDRPVVLLPQQQDQQLELIICVFYHHRALPDKRGVNYINTTTFNATDGKMSPTVGLLR